MCVVSVHQPQYLPWLGLVDKIARSDIHIILDTVQYNKRAFQHRTLYSVVGGPRYLSLSVCSKGHQSDDLKIKDVRLAETGITRKHYETLRHRYHKSSGWTLLQQELTTLLERDWDCLAELNVASLQMTLALFGVQTKLVLASDLACSGSKTELMLELTQAVGGTIYLSGTGAKDYMEDGLFHQEGVDVQYQTFEHPIYPQSHGGSFQSGCFALEWLLEEPMTAKRQFLLTRQQESVPHNVEIQPAWT